MQCLIATGEAFPAALEWAEGHLRPGADYVLWDIWQSKVHERWPADTLKMLDLMITDNNTENLDRSTLQGILNKMQELDHSISLNQRFQRLFQI